MRNDSGKGRADNPFSGMREILNPQQTPLACYWQAVVQATAPLRVAVGELEFYEDEIILCRGLTDRTELVEPLDWQTEEETCHITHRHAIQGTKRMKIYRPMQVGDVLLCLPSPDQQRLIAVDILPK